MIEQLDATKLGANNRYNQESLFSDAYTIFLKYLEEKNIECWNYVDDDNIIPSIARIVAVPDNRTNFEYIYCSLYQQEEKDIIKLFSDMLNIDLYQLNYVRSAEFFVNKLYRNESKLGEQNISNIEIYFEKNYIKILFSNNDFMLFIHENIIEIKNKSKNVTFDINDTDNIKISFDKYINRLFEELRYTLKLILGFDNLNSKFICDRFNKSLATIYSETSFNGFQLQCLEQFSNVHGLSNSVENGRLDSQTYKTESYSEFITLIQSYFSKSWAEKLNQLVNLFYFMSVVEDKNLSFKTIIRGSSKYQQNLTDHSPLLLVINYNNKDLMIQFNLSGNLFCCYDFYNVDDVDYEEHETISGKDLTPIYMKTLEHFRQRILSACGSDNMTINEDVLKVYRMMIF